MTKDHWIGFLFVIGSFVWVFFAAIIYTWAQHFLGLPCTIH